MADAVLTDYRKHVTNPVDLLTSRERELLHLIAEGSTNKDIANRLGLSVYTVEGHRGRLMEKLNLHSTGDLVRFAIRNGFISQSRKIDLVGLLLLLAGIVLFRRAWGIATLMLVPCVLFLGASGLLFARSSTLGMRALAVLLVAVPLAAGRDSTVAHGCNGS